jgi:hypothetical protein
VVPNIPKFKSRPFLEGGGERPLRKGDVVVLLLLLGLALGVVIAMMVEALLLRLFVIVLAVIGIWALSNDVGMRSSLLADNAPTKTPEVTLEGVKFSRAGYGLGGFALSGNVANESNSWLTTIDFQITLKDCQDTDCRIVGQENASASVHVPPKQMRAFSSVAVTFNDLPTLGSAKHRVYSYSITGVRTDTDRQQQAKAVDG